MLQSRNLAIDVLRGVTVAVMIIVNTPGSWSSVYSPFLHADWHGFTLTDWVFPSFLFVVGNAMSFSMAKYHEKGSQAFLIKVFRRTLLIFLIGFLLGWIPFFKHNEAGDIVFKSLETTRAFGVLQRIALCYFFASLMVFYLDVKSALWLSSLVLVGYQFILYAFGDLSLEGNAVIRLDAWLIGENHMYHGEGIAFDPEGLLSTFPAVVNVVGGYFAGLMIRQKGNTYETIAKLFVYGAVLIFAALWWDLFFPINKKLWTSSYVLLTIGINLFLLSVLIYVIEIRESKKWTYFFDVFGKNTLFIYVLAGVLADLILFFRVDGENIYNWLYVSIFQPLGDYAGSFLFALAFLTVCWLVGYLLDKRKIYIKI